MKNLLVAAVLLFSVSCKHRRDAESLSQSVEATNMDSKKVVIQQFLRADQGLFLHLRGVLLSKDSSGISVSFAKKRIKHTTKAFG